MKCPYCEKDIQPKNMNRHTNTIRCRGKQRCNTISEADYKNVYMGDFGFAYFFTNMRHLFCAKRYRLLSYFGKMTQEEFELKFLRRKDMT